MKFASSLTLWKCVANQCFGSHLVGPLLHTAQSLLQSSDSGPWCTGQGRGRPSVLLYCWPGGEQPESSEVLSTLWGKMFPLTMCTRKLRAFWKRVYIKSWFSDLIVLLIAVPAWLHKTLQAVWHVHQRLRPSLPFSQPLRRSEKPQTLPHLHPLHGCCPPSFYCLRDKLPVQQDVSRRSRRVAVARIAGGGVLGCGYDGYERPDTLLGGVAPDGAVQCCCHGNNHLFQTPWERRTTKVIRATLCGFFGLSLGRTEINGWPTNHKG